MLTIIILLTLFFFIVIAEVNYYEKANQLGFSFHEYTMFRSFRSLVIKKHFKGEISDIDERKIYKKFIELLDNV